MYSVITLNSELPLLRILVSPQFPSHISAAVHPITAHQPLNTVSTNQPAEEPLSDATQPPRVSPAATIASSHLPHMAGRAVTEHVSVRHRSFFLSWNKLLCWNPSIGKL
jgi:hypothetical protein